jgi:hypothetical protein
LPSPLILEKSTQKHEVNIAVSPLSGGEVSGHNFMCPEVCRQEFSPYDHIQLRASPKSHYNFVKWTDDTNQTLSESTILSLTITEDQTLHAIFRTNEPPSTPIVKYPKNLETLITSTTTFELMPTVFFEHPTILEFSQYLTENHADVFASGFAKPAVNPMHENKHEKQR